MEVLGAHVSAETEAGEGGLADRAMSGEWEVKLFDSRKTIPN